MLSTLYSMNASTGGNTFSGRNYGLRMFALTNKAEITMIMAGFSPFAASAEISLSLAADSDPQRTVTYGQFAGQDNRVSSADFVCSAFL